MLKPHRHPAEVLILSGQYGNKAALQRMLLFAGAGSVEVEEVPSKKITHLILCGVGSFDHGMASLGRTQWSDCLRSGLQTKKLPIMGICLGMQVLGEGSEEGTQPGLGWIPARSKHLASLGATTVPHVGWQRLEILKYDPLFEGLPGDARFYFSHSYGMHPVPPEYLLATPADGPRFAAVVRKGNTWGVQFHPEKSLRHGLRILTNFLNFRA